MLYELHLTTAPSADLGEWSRMWKTLDIKPLAIQVASDEGVPENPFQVMMAAVFEGNDDEARDWVFGLEAIMEDKGFDLVRSKIEVPLDKSVQYRPAYYETHVKSLIQPAHTDEVILAAEDLGWKASTNVLFSHEAGLEKWYFTRRAYDDGSDTFNYLNIGHQFSKAFSELVNADLPFHTVRMEKEAVIGDTNPGYDEGWA